MTRNARLGSIASAVVIIGYALYRVGTGGADAAAAPKTQPGWTTHRDPLGFTVNIPSGWTVRADTTGKVQIWGTKREQVVVWPIFFPRALRATDASQILRALVGSGPGVRWDSPQPLGRSAVRMTGRSATDALVASLAWVAPSPRGTASVLYFIGAPSAEYRARQATFQGIVESFRLERRQTAQRDTRRAPAMRYTPFRDPRENSFTFEAPVGWRTEGGAFRSSSVDVRRGWQTTSPDGSVMVSGGDPQIPIFVVPSQAIMMAASMANGWYVLTDGTRLMPRRFTAGTAFARDYVTGRFSRECSNLVIVETRDRREVVAAINNVHAQFRRVGINMQSEAGDVTFTCSRGGTPQEGYYLAITQLVEGPGNPLWSVEHLFGYLAAPNRVEEARAALDHALGSFALNPEWVRMQRNITNETSAIVTRTNDAIRGIIRDTYQNISDTQDRVFHQATMTRRGLQTLTDPVTGQQYTVESGSDYAWVNSAGRTQGSTSSTRPGVDFRELVRMP